MKTKRNYGNHTHHGAAVKVAAFRSHIIQYSGYQNDFPYTVVKDLSCKRPSLIKDHSLLALMRQCINIPASQKRPLEQKFQKRN